MSATAPLDAYSQYPRPRPERHIYQVPFDHDAVVLASAFVLSVAQACISLIDNVSCLFEANLNDYAGEFSEGGSTQKNFTGIETPWTIKEASRSHPASTASTSLPTGSTSKPTTVV